MISNVHAHKKGFTLVELSIVLVVIGLLVGGILAAKSMIDVAKAQSMVKNLQQYNIAALDFQTKYNSYPGDSNVMSPAGNRNGVLEDTDLGVTDTFTSEVANFWVHLNLNGLASKTAYTSTVPAVGIKAGVNVPEVPYGIKGTGAIPVNAAYVTSLIGGTNDGVIYLYVLGLPSNAGTTIAGVPAYTVNQARAIDIKMDDGNPTTGDVKASNTGTGCISASSYNNAYNPGLSACSLIYKINFY